MMAKVRRRSTSRSSSEKTTGEAIGAAPDSTRAKLRAGLKRARTGPTMPRALLNHSLVTAPDAKPSRWLLFLHGLLGSGANWRSFARRLVEAHPSWGAVTVDLRLHGAS